MRLSLLFAVALLLAACSSAPPPIVGPPLVATPSVPEAAPPANREAARLQGVLMTEAAAAAYPDAVGRSIGGGFKLVCWVAPSREAPPDAALDRRVPPGHALGVHDLPGFGLNAAQVMALAEANLRAGLRPADGVLVPPPGTGIVVDTGDFAESGRLALYDQWALLAGSVEGELLVAAPAADTLIYIDGREADASRLLAERARVLMAKSPRPLSASVLRWTPTGWQPATPTPGAA